MLDDYAPPVLPRKQEAAEKSHCKAKPNTYVKMKGDHKWKQTYSDVFNFNIQYLLLCTIVFVSAADNGHMSVCMLEMLALV